MGEFRKICFMKMKNGMYGIYSLISRGGNIIPKQQSSGTLEEPSKVDNSYVLTLDRIIPDVLRENPLTPKGEIRNTPRKAFPPQTHNEFTPVDLNISHIVKSCLGIISKGIQIHIHIQPEWEVAFNFMNPIHFKS